MILFDCILAWLTSKQTFNACSIRNPVVDLNAMFAVTEIPDWVIYEVIYYYFSQMYLFNSDHW